jgi:hypothetical protein
MGSTTSSERAHRAALAEFRKLWELSDVGWVREVGGVNVEPDAA